MANRSGPSRPEPCSCPSDPCSVITFRDALGLAFELADIRGPGHYGLLSDRWHRTLGLLIRPPGPRDGPPARWHPVRTGPGCAWTPLAAEGGGLLVLSVGLDPPLPPGPAEQRAYRADRASLAGLGITLRDWIRTDGDLFVSLAHLLHPVSAWPDDPAHHRRIDRRWATGEPGVTRRTHSQPSTTHSDEKGPTNRNQQRPEGPK